MSWFAKIHLPKRIGSVPLIERYILRRLTQVFLFSLCALTGAVWATQALDQLDVVTAKGQAITVFLFLTISVLPAVIQMVAPVAVLLAVIIILNSMTDDSELPIIAASGASQKAISRPVIVLGVAVMLLVAVSYHVLTPTGLFVFRTILSQVRADVIATLVQDGGFRSLKSGVTMHFRQRMPNGGFRDVFINDERDPEQWRTFSAAQGLLLEHAGGSFLFLQDGDLLLENRSDGSGSFVKFETYSLDLRQIDSAGAEFAYRAVERSTFFLLNPPPGDSYSESYPLKVRAEILERLAAPVYALVFVLIALAYLGRPNTHRQNRGLAIASVVLLCVCFRGIGFATFAVGRNVREVTPLIIAVPLAGLAFGIYANLHDPRSWMTRMEPVIDAIIRVAKRMLGRDARPLEIPDSK